MHTTTVMLIIIWNTFSNLYTPELSSLDIEHKTMSVLSQLTSNQRRGAKESDVVFDTLFDADRGKKVTSAWVLTPSNDSRRTTTSHRFPSEGGLKEKQQKRDQNRLLRETSKSHFLNLLFLLRRAPNERLTNSIVCELHGTAI